jgi:hypothetical protein
LAIIWGRGGVDISSLTGNEIQGSKNMKLKKMKLKVYETKMATDSK